MKSIIKEKTVVNIFKKDKDQSTVTESEIFDDSQIPVQLKKIMEHLKFLEKKLDTLLEQSKQRSDSRPSFGNRNFSGQRSGFRPNSSGYQGNRYEGGHRPARYGNSSGRPFQKRPSSSHAPHQGHSSHHA